MTLSVSKERCRPWLRVHLHRNNYDKKGRFRESDGRKNGGLSLGVSLRDTERPRADV